MHKKLITACMAVAAIAAFIVPVASASPVLTDDVTGATVAVKDKVIGTNTGDTIFSGGFNVTCSNALLTGEVTANSGTEIAGKVPAGSATFTGTGGGDCTSALGNTKPTVNSALCFNTVKGTDNVKITGCEGNPVTFSLNVTGVTTCRYSTASVNGTFQTNTTATINVENQSASEEEPRSFFCPDTGTLKMDFDLYRDNAGVEGNPLKIS